MTIMALLGRVPKILLFAAVAIIQVALISMMVIDRARVLRDGTEVALATRPVDPRDFLRGDYVVLNYEISSLPAGELKDTPASSMAQFLTTSFSRVTSAVAQKICETAKISVRANPKSVADYAAAV